MGIITKIAIGALVLIVAATSTPGQPPYSAEEFLSFLKATYERHEKDLAPYLISQLTLFIDLYPDSELLPEAYFYRAQTWLDRKDEYRAFTDLMRIMFIYSESDIRESANYSLNSIVQREKDFQTMLPEIREILDSSPIVHEEEPQFLAYIEFLYSLGIPKLVPALTDVAHEFIARYPNNKAVGQIHIWLAQSCEIGSNNASADASYRKYIALFPGSDSLPMMKVRWANHLYSAMKRSDTAVIILTDVINQHRDVSDAGDALYLRARIQTDEYRNYDAAIDDARRLADEYPDHIRVYDALMLIADLYSDRLRRYREAVNTYEEVVRRFPRDERAVTALIKSAKLCTDRLELFEDAAERYTAVAAMFPHTPRAADCAYEAAEIYEKELEDCRRALVAYQSVVRQFSGTRQAESAGKKAEKIKERIADGDC